MQPTLTLFPVKHSPYAAAPLDLLEYMPKIHFTDHSLALGQCCTCSSSASQNFAAQPLLLLLLVYTHIPHNVPAQADALKHCHCNCHYN
jgi:hypothetical protein